MRLGVNRTHRSNVRPGRTRSWLLSLFGVAFILLLMLALTGCSQEEIVGHGMNVVKAIKDIVISLLSYEKLRYLLLSAAAICIVVGLFKRVFWLCVVAAILFVAMAVIRSGILGNVITMIIDLLDRFIASFIKDHESGTVVTTAMGSVRSIMMF